MAVFADIIKSQEAIDMNKLRKKINSREKVIGALVSLTDPCLCEIMGNIGYGCVWIDTEHTYMSFKDVLCHLNAAKSAGIPSVVRLPQNDLTATKKILEMGPDGIIFPMVKSAEEAAALIEMTLYPPLGTRGFGPIRAIGYGAEDAKEYAEKKNFELCRFLQIEHTDMIDELEEIAEMPYVDGFIFGPNDLSGSVGDFLNVFGEKTEAEMKRAAEILKKHGKCFGIAGGLRESDIKNWAEFEPDMIFAGADWNFVYEKGKETLNIAEKYFKKGLI